MASKHVEWVREAIKANPRDAGARASLAQLLREAGKKEELAVARQEWAEVLPLEPEVWLEWLAEEMGRVKDMLPEVDEKTVERLADLAER